MDISCDHIYHYSVIYITSKYWWWPLLNFTSCICWQQSRQPVKLPHPKPRSARTCASSVTEECEVVDKQNLRSTPEIETPGTSQVTASLTRQMLPHPKEDQQATHCCATNSGVQIFTTRTISSVKKIFATQPWAGSAAVCSLPARQLSSKWKGMYLLYFWNKQKCMLSVLSPPGYILCLCYYVRVQLYIPSDGKRCELQSKATLTVAPIKQTWEQNWDIRGTSVVWMINTSQAVNIWNTDRTLTFKTECSLD
jgi:hypothetical protein